MPKLANRVVKIVQCSPASVYATLSGNMFNTQIIDALYKVVMEHLGLSHLIGEMPNTFGRSVANERDRDALERLARATEMRQIKADRADSLALAQHRHTEAVFASEMADAEIVTFYRLRQRELSPDTMTALHEYITNTPAPTPGETPAIPTLLPSNTISTENGEIEVGAGEYELNGVWFYADGTPIVSQGRNKYPDE